MATRVPIGSAPSTPTARVRQALHATDERGHNVIAIRENGFKVFKELADGSPNPAYTNLSAEDQAKEDAKPAFWASWTRTANDPVLHRQRLGTRTQPLRPLGVRQHASRSAARPNSKPTCRPPNPPPNCDDAPCAGPPSALAAASHALRTATSSATVRRRQPVHRAHPRGVQAPRRRRRVPVQRHHPPRWPVRLPGHPHGTRRHARTDRRRPRDACPHQDQLTSRKPPASLPSATAGPPSNPKESPPCEPPFVVLASRPGNRCLPDHHRPHRRRRRGQSGDRQAALAPVGIGDAAAGQRIDQQRLSRHQHPVALVRRAGEELFLRRLGDLQAVAGTRCPGPEGRTLVDHCFL